MIRRTALASAVAAAALLLPAAPALADDPYGAPVLTASTSTFCVKKDTPFTVTLTDGNRTFGQVGASLSNKTSNVTIDGGATNPLTKALSGGSATWSLSGSKAGWMTVTGSSSFDGSGWVPANTLSVKVVAGNGACR